MRISDWSSDVCSSDLIGDSEHGASPGPQVRLIRVSNISSTAWTRRAEALYAFWKMVMLASSSSRFTPASDWNRACRSSKKKEIGRAHVWTPVTNAHLVCRLLLEKKNIQRNR